MLQGLMASTIIERMKGDKYCVLWWVRVRVRVRARVRVRVMERMKGDDNCVLWRDELGINDQCCKWLHETIG